MLHILINDIVMFPVDQRRNGAILGEMLKEEEVFSWPEVDFHLFIYL